MPLTPRGVVLHLSASKYGDRAVIDQWHRERGFAEIGYHRVILNGRAKSGSAYAAGRDGEVQKGRADSKQGAHCLAKGMNTCTYGICCVGDPGTVPAGADAADASLVKQRYMTRKQSTVLIDMVARLCILKGWDPRGTFTHPNTGAKVPVITQHSDHDPENKPFCANLKLDEVRARVADRVAALRAAGDPGGFGMAAAEPDAAFEDVEELEAADAWEQEIPEPASDAPPEDEDERADGRAEDGEES